MIADKLNKKERVRLEALAQAVASTMSAGGASTKDTLDRAVVFEDFIKTGRSSMIKYNADKTKQ